MTRSAKLTIGLLMLACVGAGPADRPRPTPFQANDLVGHWLLTMPAGFEYDATIERVGDDGRFRLQCRAANLRGVYELRGRKLSAVVPDNEVMTGLAWEVKNRNVLILTEHPDTASVGSDYRNATLSRQTGRSERIPDRSGDVVR